jgi:hypothetical protein
MSDAINRYASRLPSGTALYGYALQPPFQPNGTAAPAAGGATPTPPASRGARSSLIGGYNWRTMQNYYEFNIDDINCALVPQPEG